MSKKDDLINPDNFDAADICARTVDAMPDELKKQVDVETAGKIYKAMNKLIITHKQLKQFKVADYEASIKSPLNFQAQFLDMFSEEYKFRGDPLPWEKTHSIFRFRETELTLWSGYSGHKKTMTIGHVLFHLICLGKKICLASMEMNPLVLLKRIITQAVGNPNPPHELIISFLEFLHGKLYIFDQQCSVDKDLILKVTEYSASELKCDHIFIDSLMMCGMRPDDYGAQKDFCAGLKFIANKYKIHNHLVVHMRKPPQNVSSFHIATKHEISGGADIYNQADNVLVIHSYTEKTQELRKPVEQQNPDIIDRPEMKVCFEKQRNGEFESRVNFEFCRRSLQLIEYRPIQYVNYFKGFKLNDNTN